MLINFFIGQYKTFRASQVTLVVKTPLVTAGDVTERPGFHPWVGKIPWIFPANMATHSSILAWRIPWTEEPGGPQSMGSQRVGHN